MKQIGFSEPIKRNAVCIFHHAPKVIGRRLLLLWGTWDLGGFARTRCLWRFRSLRGFRCIVSLLRVRCAFWSFRPFRRFRVQNLRVRYLVLDSNTKNVKWIWEILSIPSKCDFTFAKTYLPGMDTGGKSLPENRTCENRQLLAAERSIFAGRRRYFSPPITHTRGNCDKE